MIHALAVLLAAASVAGVLYQVATAILARRLARAPRPRLAVRPPITVLKPLAGLEPGLADNLRALCRQDYPVFQIVIGTPDSVDPVNALVESLRAEFPRADLVIVPGAGADSDARNRKIASLESLLPHARHDVLVFADADVRPDPRHLDDLAAALSGPEVGIVTCFYVGRPTEDFASRFAALWINHNFMPSAWVARALGRRDGCFGATMALPRDVLERAGGLAPLRDRLADDWALGASVRRTGLKIVFAARPVDMVVHEPSIAALFAHELRWNRTVASLAWAGHVASVVTQPVPLAAIALALALIGGLPGVVFTSLLGLATAARLAAVRVQQRAWSLPPVSPVLLLGREFLTFAVFLASLGGRSVRWRGRGYRIQRDGTMTPMKDLVP